MDQVKNTEEVLQELENISDSNERGYAAEKIATQYFLKQGYHLYKSRFCTKMAEIDLIFKPKSGYKDWLFVEVKTFTSDDLIENRVTEGQKRRLRRAFLYFLELWEIEARFHLFLVRSGDDFLLIEDFLVS